MKGFSLLELLVAITILSFLTLLGHSFSNEVLPKQRLIAKRNALAGFLQYARAESVNRGGIHVCDKSTECHGFEKGPLIIFHDRNHNHLQDGNEPTLETLETSARQRIIRNGWGKQDYLYYNAQGALQFQNGHFLICDNDYGTTLIMNWRGRLKTGLPPAPHPQCINASN